MLYDKFADMEGQLAFEFNFLSKAVSTDKTRAFIKEIHVELSDKGEDKLLGVATDGRHLHLVDPLNDVMINYYGMTPGYYRILKMFERKSRCWIARLDDRETKDWIFPNWRKIMPTQEKEVIYKTTFEGFSFNGINKNYSELAVFLHDFPEITAINLEYLETLGRGFKWEVEWYEKEKAIKFTDGDRVALVMPMCN